MSKSTLFSVCPAETTFDAAGPALGIIEHPPNDRAIEQARQAASCMSIEPKYRHFFIPSQKPPNTALPRRQSVLMSNRARSPVRESPTCAAIPQYGPISPIGTEKIG